MKNLLIPTFFIISLIAFFVIIDRKEFNRHNNVQMIQKEKPIFTNSNKSYIPLSDVVTEAPFSKKDSTHHINANKNEQAPRAVPVLSKEEAERLIADMMEEEKEAKKRGFIFFKESFLLPRDIAGIDSIQETKSWRFVTTNTANKESIARVINGTFTVDSDSPLEYYFDHPVFEHSMYCYTLACTAIGKGTITISAKGTNEKKIFKIDSKTPKTVAQLLGDAKTFSTRLDPTIQFQGNLSIEQIVLYQKKKNSCRTICFGEIEMISKVPDINSSNYPDCYYTAKLSIKQILDGEPAPEDIQLLIPAFLGNRIDPLSSIMKKGSFKLAIRPLLAATTAEQQIEQVDEIESFAFAPYILVDAIESIIPELHVSAIPILEGREYISPYDYPVNPPSNEKYRNDSNNSIHAELLKVNEIISSLDDSIDSINASFQASWSETSNKYDKLSSSIIWAKEQNSFFALPKEWKFIHPHMILTSNLEALKELDSFFKTQGVQLIIQIIPDYRDIAALVLNPQFQKYGDQQSAIVAQQLLKNGIEVQYLSDSLIKDCFNYERLFFYPNDFHPDQGTMDIITSRASERLKLFEDVFPKELNPDSFTRKYQDTGYKNNLKWPSNCNIGAHKAGQNVQTPYIYYDGKRIISNPKSKIIVIGNSFIQEPFDSEAYIAYLATKMLYTAQSKAVYGISALTYLPNLLLLETNKYLKDKLVAFFPIGITYLTSDRLFTNIRQMDRLLANDVNNKHVFSLSVKGPSTKCFPSSFDFSDPIFQNYISNHLGLVALSADQPEITLSLPESSSAKSISISIQPTYAVRATVLINDHPYQLRATDYAPNWENIKFDINNNCSSLSIRLDLDNCSKNPFVLIGNISGFECL